MFIYHPFFFFYSLNVNINFYYKFNNKSNNKSKQYKFNEWTKKHVGIASRLGAVERYALWAFIVDANDVNKKPSLPLIVEGDEIRNAIIDFKQFQLAVSRLTKLQKEVDQEKALQAISKPLVDSF